MTARIVYMPPKRHRCDLPKWDGLPPRGAVAFCDSCGAGWVIDDDDFGYAHWRQIGPWPFDRKARRAIRAALRKKQEAGG